MRRSVCYTEPSSVRAGQISTWRFYYNPSFTLPKGTKLKFDILSEGKMIDWETPLLDLGQAQNVIYLELSNGTVVKGKGLKVPKKFVPQFEFVLPKAVEAGDPLCIVMGAPPEHTHKDETGNGAQLFVQRRKPFYLYVDVTGKGHYEEPEPFSLDIKGNLLKTIKIFTPSFVSRNKRFDITVRFEDEFDNLTGFAPEDTLIQLSYENLRDSLSWRLFVPETGFVILPNLYFNEEGVYKIRLENLNSGDCFVSPPIKCFQDNNQILVWGLLHGESTRIDASENIEACLRHFRDEKSYNFFASSPFESEEEFSQDLWKLISQNIADFNEEDRFATILGFQYVGHPGVEGIRQILFSKDNKSLPKQKDSKTYSLAKLYKTISPKELISIPCMTASESYGFDFVDFNPDFERVVEIYNCWGSSENTESEGNPYPIKGKENGAKRGTILDALKQNKRFGFVAGGYDDRGIYSSFYDNEQIQYHPGFTAVLCNKYSRDAIFEALYNRHCYATTGPRIILGFKIADIPMGSEINISAKPGLMFNRHISGYVAGTDMIKKVEIIRNGEVLHTFYPKSDHFDYEYDDMVSLSDVTLESGEDKPPFVFYYLRMFQENAMAWSSPIWIDLDQKM
ncbi:MAG: DUF3604 domain-containing protein [Victivallaceae bacterium]